MTRRIHFGAGSSTSRTNRQLGSGEDQRAHVTADRTARACVRPVISVGLGLLAMSAAYFGAGTTAAHADGGQESSSLAVGDIVGTFELGAPSVPSFTLHGTLPLPPRTF